MIPTNSLFAESLREGDEPSADFIDDDGTTNDATIGTDDRIGVPLRRIVPGNIDVDALADDLTAGAPVVRRPRSSARRSRRPGARSPTSSSTAPT